jgi:VanZ family protein
MNRKKCIFNWALVLFWAVAIFFFSSQPAVQSNGNSLAATRIIIKTISYVIPLNADEKGIDSLVSRYNHIVRKIAHGTVYFVFGVSTARNFVLSGIGKEKAFALAVLLCFAFATTDEFHQMFVPGRSGEFSDVLLDTFGGGLGIWLYILW